MSAEQELIDFVQRYGAGAGHAVGFPQLVEAVQEEARRDACKLLLRSLQEVRAQRGGVAYPHHPSARNRQQGEIWGLDVAIKAIERRLK